MTKMAPVNAAIMRFDDDASVSRHLMTGQADLLAGSTGARNLEQDEARAKQESKIVLNDVYMSMAVKKGASDLLHT